MTVEFIYHHGSFKGYGSFDKKITAVAIANGRFIQFGTDSEILALKTNSTQVIDLKGKTVIPGLNDSHLHLICGGLSFNLENQLADFAVLSKDFFAVPDEEIKDLYSLMTVLGGKIVHASDEFSSLNPSLPPVSPDWSPIKYFGTYGANKLITQNPVTNPVLNHQHDSHERGNLLGCICWAF